MPNGVFVSCWLIEVMPSTHSVMEKQKLAHTAASTSLTGENNFICTVCGDGFSQYPNVLTHMAVHGPLESFSFDGSSNGFEVPREYILQENGTLTVFNGSTQSHSYVRPSSPGILPSHRSAPFKLLSPTLRSQPSTNQHVFRPRTAVKDHRCEICNRVFNSLHNLHCHQQYRNQERGFKCTLCCKSFHNRGDLMKHLREHANQRFKSCGYCGKRFLKVDALNAHQKENHSSLLKTPLLIKSENKPEKKTEKQYSCKKCKFAFFWFSDLQVHSLYYCKGVDTRDSFMPEVESNPVSPSMEDTVAEYYSNGTALDVTNEDSKVFRDSSGVLEADYTFTPYRCGLCGDRFQNLSTLKQHHFTHQTQEEIDKLNEESQFTFKPAPLQGRRRRSKSNGKLHPCKHCPRVFNHSSSLSRHMRYHKGTMHTCPICARRFPQRCDLRRHLAMYHKTELEKKPSLKLLYAAPQNAPNLLNDEQKTGARVKNKAKSPSESELAANEQQSGRANRANYKCHECGKQFGLLCVYQRHLRYHKLQELTKCPICPAQFKNASSLERHLKNHPSDQETSDIGQSCHSPVAIGGSTLEICDAENKKGAYMDYTGNVRQNASENLYECTECTETFSNLEMFLQHQITHGSDSNM